MLLLHIFGSIIYRCLLQAEQKSSVTGEDTGKRVIGV